MDMFIYSNICLHMVVCWEMASPSLQIVEKFCWGPMQTMVHRFSNVRMQHLHAGHVTIVSGCVHFCYVPFVHFSKCFRCRPDCHCAHRCNVFCNWNLYLIHFVSAFVIVSHRVLHSLHVPVLLCQEGLRTILPSCTALMCTCDQSLFYRLRWKVCSVSSIVLQEWCFCYCSNPFTPLSNCNTSVRSLSVYLQFYADFVKVSSLCHAFLYDGPTFSCFFDQ